MIIISGVKEGDEFEAAKRLQRRLLDLWPDLAQSKTDVVRMFVGLKMHGQKIEDLDLVVIGSFETPRKFDAEYKFYPREGEPVLPRSARVRNFALVIEVKSHDPTGVRFENTVASVRYVRNGKETWECVTEKNRAQMFEFKRWLDRYGLDNIHVQNLVLFTGLKERDLPKRPHVCIASDTSFERILNVLGQVTAPWINDRLVTLSYGPDDAFASILGKNSPLFKTLEPTSLDRRRMDLIAKAALPDGWLDDLGQRQILLKGRGGVGKTVILLQMAYRAFDRDGLRSLLLTFNKALVADMRRTMSLLGVPRSVERGGVGIETVHSFIGALMIRLGVIESFDGFLDAYDSHKENLLEYLRTGAISQIDLASALANDATDLDWDLVFIDEGQDWPRDEIAILKAVYGARKLIVSDGVDQYVRLSVADWSTGLARSDLRSRRLRKCLRMKANVAAFVGDMALSMGLSDWDLEPNAEASGGRIIVVEGDLVAGPDVVHGFVQDARDLGNYPVDMLACVPPKMVSRSGAAAGCLAADAFVASGGKVWDGTARDTREHYPTDRDALRFVQYDSCRGLEGWTAIHYTLDELWEYKHSQWFTEGHEVDPLLQSPDDAALQHAARWVMIPLTRAIDTLVINVSASPSAFKDVLRAVADRRADCVEWIEMPG